MLTTFNIMKGGSATHYFTLLLTLSNIYNLFEYRRRFTKDSGGRTRLKRQRNVNKILDHDYINNKGKAGCAIGHRHLSKELMVYAPNKVFKQDLRVVISQGRNWA